MHLAGKVARWTALIVLLNIGLGFCDCLRDAIPLVHRASSPALTSSSRPADAPSCGDNCGSCLCCASIVAVEPAHFTVDFAVSRFLTAPFLSFSNSDRVLPERPPRA